MKLAIVIGTRAEALKMKSIIHHLKHFSHLDFITIYTGQHPHLLPHKSQCQTPVRKGLCPLRDREHQIEYYKMVIIDQLKPYKEMLVLVQGDTYSAIAGARAGKALGFTIGHIEAGLRTFDHSNPYPEEMNRTEITQLATWHYAPTARSVSHLVNEGISQDKIFLTGNTIIDLFSKATQKWKPYPKIRKVKVLVLLHRQENRAFRIQRWYKWIQNLSLEAKYQVDWVLHPNPATYPTSMPFHGRIKFHLPLPYASFQRLLNNCNLLITDSGGVTEEAAFMGKPILIARIRTERPEVIEVGLGELISSTESNFKKQIKRLEASVIAGKSQSIFGDGHAAKRIVNHLETII